MPACAEPARSGPGLGQGDRRRSELPGSPVNSERPAPPGSRRRRERVTNQELAADASARGIAGPVRPDRGRRRTGGSPQI